MAFGSGDLRFDVHEGWAKLPPHIPYSEANDIPGVATDSNDRVYVLTRGQYPVLVFEPDGTFVESWGQGLFGPRSHGITIDAADNVYVVDDGDHSIRKCTTKGEVLMKLGTSGQPSDTGYTGSIPSITHGGPPFNRPTSLAVGPNGDLYVADGYGNCRVHQFAADGTLRRSWGDPGTGPGQFNLPHGIWCFADGRVLVADRENDRVQIFSPDGEFLDQWTDIQRPTEIFIDNAKGLVYVSELWWRVGQHSYVQGDITVDQPARVSILDTDGKVLTRWGSADRCAPGNFVAPHGLWVDSRGSMYVAEVMWTFAGKAGLVPADCHSLQKFERVR
jgi:DNA-binding beta-propeller fold protein YncE